MVFREEGIYNPSTCARTTRRAAIRMAGFWVIHLIPLGDSRMGDDCEDEKFNQYV
jgi:hypothetical protein